MLLKSTFVPSVFHQCEINVSIFLSLYWTVVQSFWIKPHGIWFWEIKLFCFLSSSFVFLFSVSHVWIFDLLDWFYFLFVLLSRFPKHFFLSLLLYLVLFFLANFIVFVPCYKASWFCFIYNLLLALWENNTFKMFFYPCNSCFHQVV